MCGVNEKKISFVTFLCSSHSKLVGTRSLKLQPCVMKFTLSFIATHRPYHKSIYIIYRRSPASELLRLFFFSLFSFITSLVELQALLSVFHLAHTHYYYYYYYYYFSPFFYGLVTACS
ncbi:hypothetical protein CLIB1423_11S04390 [[Candida] railenensis]|uniref:Uncharacterized protein n=1 Tax=[Candida] railenensis TaxID=45579 RepID=A0A9P0QRJ4_9ASCO|nr:hypothetical protein CLIB1423_11S04390 [[Candida] railenensis]